MDLLHLLMAMRKRLSRICFITPDRGDAERVEEVVSVALEAGIRWVQYRRKSGTRRQLFCEAKKLRDLTGRFGALFIVNDFADIALAVEADGIHIGQDDFPLREARKIIGEKIIGVSTHNLKEALAAEKEGADYIGFGPIFPTATKDAGPPKGSGPLVEIKHSINIPVIAIGGITPLNAAHVFRAGCDGVAVSSGIFSGDITANVADFLYNVSI
jgi:thiamine-phosphate pyrophosphorylase